MEKKQLLKGAAAFCLAALMASCAQPGRQAQDERPATRLTFAYLTDVHLNKDNSGNGNEGLQMALKAAADNGAEFVIFGGDNADTDALGDAEVTADTLHARFARLVKESGLPAYFTIGNHDRFYLSGGKADTLGFGMFEKHYGPTHRSFSQKGVHFVILNSLYPQSDGAPPLRCGSRAAGLAQGRPRYGGQADAGHRFAPRAHAVVVLSGSGGHHEGLGHDCRQ